MSMIKKMWLPLAAAALTAVALAAVSVAQNDDGSGSGDGERRADVVIAGPGGPPMAFNRLSEEDRQALEEFRSCLEDQGVEPPPEPPRLEEGEMPEPGTFERRLDPPSEEERAKMREAFEACSDKLPEGVRAGHGPLPCGPPPGAPKGEGAAIPAPPPSAGSQQEGTVAPAAPGASS
jgi:hypothetical protein